MSSVIAPKERRKIKLLVKELKSHKALHTEFVSVYVPSGYDISKISNHLADELGTASNIKSSATRKNVQGALDKMIQTLKLFKVTPKNGLAVFAGNVASKEGKSDMRSWYVEPPVPLNVRIYRCDKDFVTEYLEDIMMDKRVYGLVVMDRRDADLALLKGKTIVHLQKTHSEVPGKTKAGGQSAQRYARIREGSYKDHFKKIADLMKEHFFHFGNNLQGIILGGPGITVNDFMNKDYVTGDLKKKIIGTKDLSYTGEFGLQELLEKSADLLSEEEVAQEKKIMQVFFTKLVKEIEKTAYGKDEVEKALSMSAIDILLLSESLPDSEVMRIEEVAETSGTKVKVISTETREGVQLKQLGGYAAILRFPIG